MYNIEFRKELTSDLSHGTCQNVESIVIDLADIDNTMIATGNLRYLAHYKRLIYRQFKNNPPKVVRILNNNSNNEQVINCIIRAWWVIHERGIANNENLYRDRRDKYFDMLQTLEKSNNKEDRCKSILMKNFIKSFDEYTKDNKNNKKTGS